MTITGIPSAVATYFRPISSITSQTVTGIELSRTPIVATGGGSCEYLKEYLRLGMNNNPTEVTKLQLFLKNYEGFSNLAVTGFFDITTDQAVRSFQDKYKKDVLDAWNLPGNTGYVYYTTEKKINEIYCQREFPLDQNQITEIEAFKALINRINLVGNTGLAPLPLVGINVVGGSGGSVAGASTVKTPVTISVTKVDDAPKIADTNPEDRGRIALADLLATAPNITSGQADQIVATTTITTVTDTASDTETVVQVPVKRGLFASVASSIAGRFDSSSPLTRYLILVILPLVLLAALTYYVMNAKKKKLSITETSTTSSSTSGPFDIS
jgi:hypothetical protein